MHHQFLLGVEYSPLNGADGNGLSGSDLRVFPLPDEAQRHRLAFLRIEKLHPTLEFSDRPEWTLIRGGQRVANTGHNHGRYLPLALGEIPARGMARHLKEPGAKQF